MTSLLRGGALLTFPRLVTELGGQPAQLLRARGIDPAAAGDDNRFISGPAAAADAADALDCPDFGLRPARAQGIQILGPVAVILRNAQTVAAAMNSVRRYLHNVAPLDHTALLRGLSAAVFTLETSVAQLAHHDQWVEKGLGIAMAPST